MRSVLSAAAILLAVPAAAADLTLTHQVRLLDATGAPLEGAIPVVVDLHSHETNEALLWTTSLTPVFEQGYASLVLDVGSGGEPIDSAWFADPVWIEITVDGTVLSPRMRVTDVPVRPEQKRVFISGTGWSTTGGTLASSASVTEEGVTFTVGTNHQVLARIPLAGAGEYPDGVKVDLVAAFQLLTADADPVFLITDPSDNAGPEFCGLQVLDQNGLQVLTGVEGGYPGAIIQTRGIGTTTGASNDFLVLQATWIIPPGQESAADYAYSGYVTGTVESTSLAGECTGNMHVQNGVYLNLLGNDVTEQYRFESVYATLTPL